MNIAFTLCSNNYLAHAKTLGDSLLATNPDIKFVIGLTDKLSPEIDYGFFEPFDILTYDKIGYDFFDEMIEKYNIIEFNTSVKPFYFEYFFSLHPDSIVYYFDPDILCYGSLNELHELLHVNNFVLTPHITKPYDKVSIFEPIILNVGIYNLGFIGIKNTSVSTLFLKWWQNRLKEYCYISPQQGLFVDQIWINFMPLLFEGVHVTMLPNYNMACWNLGERKLIKNNDKYFVNSNDYPLVFFHFSGFNPNDLDYISKFRTPEFALDLLPEFKDLYLQYSLLMKQNNFDSLSKVKPLLPFKPLDESDKKITYTFKQKMGRSLNFRLNKFIKRFFDI